MNNKIRNPAAAGMFYPADKEQLIQNIEECFTDKRGPGSKPSISKKEKNVKGVVVPHAGYPFSGAIAAHAFDFIASNGFADCFIVLGPNHTGIGSAVSTMTDGSWKTPLGDVDINKKIGKEIFNGIVDDDEKAHSNEHSIEVQLPFLQYISKDFDFVPISMSMQDYQTSEEIGGIIADVIKKSEKKIVIVASSDFSHVGFNYMSMPPAGMKVNEYAEKQDKKAIEKILKLDPKGLVDTVEQENISMCGYGPVASLLVAAKNLGATKAELLKYGSSYDVHPGDSCVGYGSIVVY